MRHELSTAVYAQGWLQSQFESMLEFQTDDANKQVAEKILEMWKVIDETMDDLVEENRNLTVKLNRIYEASK